MAPPGTMQSPALVAKVCVATAFSVLLIACSSDSATAPASAATPTVTFSASARDVNMTRMGLADASTRLAPAVQLLAANADLSDALGLISKAVDKQDAVALQRGLTLAGRAVDRIEAAADNDFSARADVDALRLTLTDAARLIAPQTDPTTHTGIP